MEWFNTFVEYEEGTWKVGIITEVNFNILSVNTGVEIKVFNTTNEKLGNFRENTERSQGFDSLMSYNFLDYQKIQFGLSHFLSTKNFLSIPSHIILNFIRGNLYYSIIQM